MTDNHKDMTKDAELFEPELVTSLRDELKQIIDLPENELGRFEEIRVEVDWIPTVSVVLKPRH